jgi:Arc/MetJ-type ribon-helix-helix transcriptional regulator
MGEEATVGILLGYAEHYAKAVGIAVPIGSIDVIGRVPTHSRMADFGARLWPVSIPQCYHTGMTVQMTIRVDDDLAAFVDHAAKSGEGSRADVINRAIKREVRRRAAERDAQIYTSNADPDLESDAYVAWAAGNARQVGSELD